MPDGTLISNILKMVAECREALLADPTRLDALNGLYRAYWGCADAYYNRGDFDDHVDLQARIAQAAQDVADHHHLGEVGTRYISYESLCGLGHQGMALDTAYKLRRLGLYHGAHTTLVISKWGENTNLHYLNYWRSMFDGVIESPGAMQLLGPLCGGRGVFGLLEDRFVVTRMIEGDYLAYSEANAYANARWEHGPVLELDDYDRQRGEDALKRLGLPPGAWFVTLHVRESPYNDFAAGRNVSIMDYLPAIGAIATAGGWVVRLGAPNMTPLPHGLPNVIDYAHSEAREDWLDVYLMAACRFFVGTQSGPAQIPPTFGVRSALTNWQMGFRPTYPTDTVIFRRYEQDGRPLSIRESFARKLPYIETPAQYLPGVRTLANTPEEIRELVEEVMSQPQGVNDVDWAGQQDRLNLVRQYNALQHELTAGMRHNPAGWCPVGAAWLGRYGGE